MKYNLKRTWTIHVLHHTHLDIGYTDTQKEVLDIQIHHLQKAFDLIEQFKHKKPEEQFKWNPEITWAINEWIKTASEPEKDAFISYVQKGFIGLDGLYGNVLTGLCRPEELMASFQSKKELEILTDTIIDSAMITDIPGWTWGFVTALAENGIKYLSSGPNRADRIGRIRDFNDKPFYWVNPSSKQKVLVWVHGKGYSWFHDVGLIPSKNLARKLKPAKIFKYLKELEHSGYPYDDLIIRYNIGRDNGPPCEKLSDIVTNWNKLYPNMKLNITTTSEAFMKFEQKYGDTLPVLRGDITPYWEDGALSTARETAIAKNAGELIPQLETLSSMMDKQIDTKQMWYNTFLYNEHTWGAYNSISKPDHPFAKSQWEWKRNYALQAYNQVIKGLNNATPNKLLNTNYQDCINNISIETTGPSISIVNTHNYQTTQPVEVVTSHNTVLWNGEVVPSQKLGHKLLFIAEKVKPYENRILTLQTRETKLEEVHHAIEFNLEGELTSYTYHDVELLQPEQRLNNYVFKAGKWGSRNKKVPAKAIVELLFDGPLVTVYKVTKHAYKANSLVSTYTFHHTDNSIYIENIIDRPISRKKEGIYFAFPFSIPDGTVTFDTQYGVVELEQDQIPGSNKNFITANRYVDISNKNYGVTVILFDAPIFKAGVIDKDPFRIGNPDLCGWKKTSSYTGSIYSYVMNNYWMTNYKADQPGTTVFRYLIKPHLQISIEKTYRYVESRVQPLLIFDTEVYTNPILDYDNDFVVTTKRKRLKDAVEIRLYNPTSSIQNVSFKGTVEVVSPNKKNLLENNQIQLDSHEIITIKKKV